MPRTFRPPRAAALLGALAALGFASRLTAADNSNVVDALKTITSVAREGAGNEAAATAWKQVTAAGAAALVPTLTAFDDAGPAAANWLRAAVDAIAEAEAKTGRRLPADDLEAFLKDTKRHPAARRIAFELLAAQDRPRADRLLPGMTDDPSNEIRRDAIADRLEKVKKLPDGTRIAEYRTLFAAARDKDQVETLADLLEKAGEKPDVTRHFGFITEWHVVGPFPSPGGSGFDKPFPPEAGVDLGATYPGVAGKVAWKYGQSDAVYGTMDMNHLVGKHHDAAAYAYAVVLAEKDTPVELRATGKNAIQLFLNGTKLYGKNEYHHGTYPDQHPARAVLKAGRNEILVKVLQNNQTDSWAQDWTFALRVCDATGGAVPLKQLTARDGKTETVTPGAIRPAAKKEDAK